VIPDSLFKREKIVSLITGFWPLPSIVPQEEFERRWSTKESQKGKEVQTNRLTRDLGDVDTIQ